MQASGILVSEAPHTSKRKLCPESDKLLRKWIVDILFRSAKPSLNEKKEILEEIRKRDPWYELYHINSFILRYWNRLYPPSKNQENATEWPSVAASLSVDVTKAFRALLCERTDASYEAIITWAANLGIEEDVAKGYVNRLRRTHETANERRSSVGGGHLEKLDSTQPTQGADALNGSIIPPHSPSRESGSPQLESLVSTLDLQHPNSSPIILSPRNASHASGAPSLRVGPVGKAGCAEGCPVAPNSESDSKRLASPEEEEEEEEECPVASNSKLLALPEEEEEEEEEEEDSTVHGHDNDTVVAGVKPAHSSPSTFPLPMGAEGFNHRSRPASPSGTSHDILLIAASLDVPTTQDDMLIDTPAQVLAPNISLDNSCQINTFPSLAISAMDSLDFAMVDRFEGSAPANENTPKVPCLPSFAESSETQENVDSPPSTEELANKFESYRDKMDSLILRVRSARRAQEKRQHSPYPKACILPICNRCRSRHCCANLPTSII